MKRKKTKEMTKETKMATSIVLITLLVAIVILTYKTASVKIAEIQEKRFEQSIADLNPETQDYLRLERQIEKAHPDWSFQEIQNEIWRLNPHTVTLDLSSANAKRSGKLVFASTETKSPLVIEGFKYVETEEEGVTPSETETGIVVSVAGAATVEEGIAEPYVIPIVEVEEQAETSTEDTEKAAEDAEEESKKEEWYTQENITLLGDLMYAEEEAYINDPSAAVVFKAAGSVVLNRAAENQGFFPDTIYEVIHQGEGTEMQQYETATLNKIGNIDTPEIVYQWAEELLRDGPIGPSNLVYQGSVAQGEVWSHYGNQYFCLSENIN